MCRCVKCDFMNKSSLYEARAECVCVCVCVFIQASVSVRVCVNVRDMRMLIMCNKRNMRM